MADIRVSRPLEIIVVLAALGGFVWVFYQSRVAAQAGVTPLSEPLDATVNPLGSEISPSTEARTMQDFSNYIQATGATDPTIQAGVVGDALTSPAGVGLFFNGAPGSGSNL